MRNLIDFIQKNLYWLVFLFLEVVSLISLFKYNSYQGSVYFTTANQMVGGAYRLTSDVSSYLKLGKENAYLEQENEQLRSELLALKKKLRKRQGNSTFVNIQDTMLTDYKFVGAQVISSTLHRTNNLLTLDKGSKDGIRPEMGVVCSQGVVGIVYLTSRNYSIVIPLLNTSSQISCRMKNSQFFGTMQWQRGDPDISYVNDIPRHAKVEVGEIVETNGYSDIFPEGIPIGRVKKVKDSSDGMSYSLEVELFTDFKTLRNVSIITNYTKPERKALEEKADSLMQSVDD